MTIVQEPLTEAAPAGDPAAPVLPDHGPAPVDPEYMDTHLLADGDLDTTLELPRPTVPELAPLLLEPPAVRPPRFDQLWRQLVDSENASQPAPQRTGRVVTVFSPKGGAGTTTVAVNLALLLASHGRHSVCLVDLDLEFGDVSIMTGLSPARSIVDAVDAVGAPLTGERADATLDSLVTPWRERVDCILAPVDPSAAERIGPQLVAQLLAALRARYEYVVVDTPSQLTEHVLDALDAAEHQVLVTTPQLPALKSMRLVLDTLQLLGYDIARRYVVLNQGGGTRALDRDGVQAAIGHPVAAVVPANADVATAADTGVPLAAQRADHPVVSALATFTTGAISGELAARRNRHAKRGRRHKR